MTSQRHIYTERLLLWPFVLTDAPDVRRLAGDRDIAATTLRIPHPYPEGVAEAWIGSLEANERDAGNFVFAVTLRAGGTLIGAVGLEVAAEHQHAELGYWIGKPFWNNGYASEAAAAVVRFGFHTLQLHRIFAHHMTDNPASGRVLVKIGMTYEGTMRQHIHKWGQFKDVAFYGMLRQEMPPA